MGNRVRGWSRKAVRLGIGWTLARTLLPALILADVDSAHTRWEFERLIGPAAVTSGRVKLAYAAEVTGACLH